MHRRPVKLSAEANMPKRCAYGTCKSDSRYPKSLEGGVEFFAFPKPKTQEERCRLWIKQCGRPDEELNPSKINKNSFVCSKHFVNGRPTPESPNPIANPSFAPRRSKKPPAKRAKCDEQDAEVFNSNSTEEAASQHNSGTDTTAHHCTGSQEEELKILKKKLKEQKLEMVNLKMELSAKDGQIQLLEKEIQIARTTDTLTPESLNQSHVPGYFHYCTGFTYGQFNSLCEFLKVPNDSLTPQTQVPLTCKTLDTEDQKMPLRSQVLLTLMKLRLNLDHKDLAFRFQFCVQNLNTIINSWVDYMYDQLGQLSSWPHRDVISQNLPDSFKQDFPNTFAILDCTELKIERPGSLSVQNQTCSTYESANTLKSLVACDPRGAVMYVSDLFSGSVSDKEIFHQCNIIKLLRGCIQCGYLKAGDGLIADKSFLIEKEVEEIGLKIKIPPFDRSNHQMSHEDVEMTQKVAKHKIHVERAIAEIKKFSIVSGRIPISQLGNINQIWYVVSMLSNFQSHITKG